MPRAIVPVAQGYCIRHGPKVWKHKAGEQTSLQMNAEAAFHPPQQNYSCQLNKAVVASGSLRRLLTADMKDDVFPARYKQTLQCPLRLLF